MMLAPCRFLRGRVQSQALTRSSSHKGIYTVHKILTIITRLTRFCLQSLHYRFVVWTKPDTTSLLFGALIDLPRSRSQLVAENALLRQQLIILRRQVKRPACTRADRMLLVLLTKMVRTWKQALFIVQPETLLRWHSQGFKLFWKYRSRSTSTKPRISQETVVLIQEMARDNRLWGAERIRGERALARHSRVQTYHSEVHESCAYHQTTRTDVEDLLTHACPANLGVRRACLSQISSSARCLPSSSSN